MTGNLIRFPQERRTAAVEDYREEPAKVLVLYIGQRQTIPAHAIRVTIAGGDPADVEASIREFWGLLI
jgi:hypothetical protein